MPAVAQRRRCRINTGVGRMKEEDFKATKNINAETREQLKPEVALEVITLWSKFNEELGFLCHKYALMGLPVHFIIGSLHHNSFGLSLNETNYQLEQIEKFYKDKGKL